MPVNIQPFGTSTDSATHPLAQIKLFGCTVVDFTVSADWSSQGGSLSCRLIESETDGDRLTLPVLGSPVLFELKNTSNQVVFQYIGIVDSFSRSSSNSKTYSVNISSPMKILESTTVIMDGYAGLGASQEGSYLLNGMVNQDFGHNNNRIIVDNNPGQYHWWNVSNLINVYGILENDDPLYRVPSQFELVNNKKVPIQYGDFGFSGKSKDGIPLIKLMWALHIGINHLPPLFEVQSYDAQALNQRQKTLGGNLLFGRHNYNLYDDKEALPYYYHFDAIHLYRQIVDKLGPEYRLAGEYKTLSEIISHLCNEANLEFFTYIDIYTDPTIGDPTLQEQIIYPEVIDQLARFNWIAGIGQTMNTIKFPLGGNYGGTIRIQTIDKNSFFNPNRPFSNIAYNLIGLEVPDLRDTFLAHDGTQHPDRNGEGWLTNSKHGIHPGRRPINNTQYGLSQSGSATYNIYSDPLDASGIAQWRGNNVEIQNESWGFTKVGTMSVASGGSFPVEATGIGGFSVLFDSTKMDTELFPRIKNSDISIKLNDFTTMKVITGGYQTRLVTAPRPMLRHYWGDIMVPTPSNPRETMDTETDPIGLDETSTRKIPVVTQILDPRDVDDYILVDMKSDFGPVSVGGVLYQGIYAASLLEIRCAMTSYESWKAFIEGYKYNKVRNLVKAFYPGCTSPSGQNGVSKDDLTKSTERVNAAGGIGYAGVSELLGLGNIFALHKTNNELLSTTNNKSGEPIASPSGSGSGLFGLGIDIRCAEAELSIKKHLFPPIHEKLKEIGDTHYGKSWYAPAPYAKSMQDLDGDNLVGNFKRSWDMNDSAYVEPSDYYRRQIPQSNMFIQDGKVSPFINYDYNFISSNTGAYDVSYQQDITNVIGQNQKVCNFSEYSIDKLCMTKYFPATGVDKSGNILFDSGSPIDIIHAAPENIEDRYSYLPLGYDYYYNRAKLPYSDIITGLSARYVDSKNSGSGMIPSGEGQTWTKYFKSAFDLGYEFITDANSFLSNVSPNTKPLLPGAEPGQIPEDSGYYEVSGIIGIPSCTNHRWLVDTMNGIQSLDYAENGRFCFPFIKFTTSRTFLPVPHPGASGGKKMDEIPLDGINAFLGTSINRKNGDPTKPGSMAPSGRFRQYLTTEDQIVSTLKPFQACVVPYSFNYGQISTRYVYGPWMTNLPYIPFRGKIEYEQDESLVPENFLIPTNFGPFGGYTLDQTSGLTGMNLAAQGRANAIDDFALFAVEEGSITVPGAPAIKRIGDSLYGIQQVTDIKISVNNQGLETTYSFKTITPKFGKNNRDLEKKMTKISNDIKKLKLR